MMIKDIFGIIRMASEYTKPTIKEPTNAPKILPNPPITNTQKHSAIMDASIPKEIAEIGDCIPPANPAISEASPNTAV